MAHHAPADCSTPRRAARPPRPLPSLNDAERAHERARPPARLPLGFRTARGGPSPGARSPSSTRGGAPLRLPRPTRANPSSDPRPHLRHCSRAPSHAPRAARGAPPPARPPGRPPARPPIRPAAPGCGSMPRPPRPEPSHSLRQPSHHLPRRRRGRAPQPSDGTRFSQPGNGGPQPPAHCALAGAGREPAGGAAARRGRPPLPAPPSHLSRRRPPFLYAPRRRGPTAAAPRRQGQRHPSPL
jgi:hypothetical protein